MNRKPSISNSDSSSISFGDIFNSLVKIYLLSKSMASGSSDAIVVFPAIMDRPSFLFVVKGLFGYSPVFARTL